MTNPTNDKDKPVNDQPDTLQTFTNNLLLLALGLAAAGIAAHLMGFQVATWTLGLAGASISGAAALIRMAP
jgi:hypothetical protein